MPDKRLEKTRMAYQPRPSLKAVGKIIDGEPIWFIDGVDISDDPVAMRQLSEEYRRRFPGIYKHLDY